jgi:hypothetical protein
MISASQPIGAPRLTRRQWEYSHLANAGLVLLALILIMLGVLASSRASGMAAAQGRVAPG